MKLDIIICSNLETVANLSDIANETISAAITAGSRRCLELTGQHPAEDSTYRNWHGGKHDQFRCRCGLVSIREEFRGTSLEDIAHEINSAIDDALCCASSQT